MNDYPLRVAGIAGIPEHEFNYRLSRVAKALEENGQEGMVFFSAASIAYLTGSPMMQTERPMAFIYKTDGTRAMLVPRLELEHAQETVKNCDIRWYPEYPSERHPMYFLADLLKELKLDKKVAADGMGYPGVYGYHGPSIPEVVEGCEVMLMGDLIQQLKILKSETEIEFLRVSAQWANYSLTLLQQYTKPGLREIDVSSRACNDAAQAMMRTLGKRFHPSSPIGCGIYCGYRGQIGKRSYFPHAVTTNAMFRDGDMLGSGASANILGYASELERVLFIGEPTAEMQKYYQLSVEAQDAAIAMIKPGNRCCDVDREMLRFFKEHDLMPYWRHHTGHSLGTGDHEAPFFDIGDETVIEPGMCFSVEPGIYVEGLGGFRLSDTVVVYEDHLELLTYYSRDIEDLICG